MHVSILPSYKDIFLCNLMNRFRGKLVKIRYYDHVEFRKASLDKVSPVLREAVGWIVHEDPCAIILVFDRPYNVEGGEFKGKPSGLCILKKDVVGVQEVAEDS
jgi:hypothetical protein